MTILGTVAPSGVLGIKHTRADGSVEIPISPWPSRELSLREIAAHGLPQGGLPEAVNAWRTSNVRHLWRGARRVLTARRLGLPTMYGTLFASVYRSTGEINELGLISMRVVTNNGVGFIVDAFQNLTELENMKYHGVGTGVAAEAAGDSALGTESTTALNPDNTRATGSTTESAANIYRTVGTPAFDASEAITEHGIFSQAATGGGTLLDRSVFSAINVVSGDSIQFTYDLTLSAGG